VAGHVPQRFVLGCVGVACAVLLLATPALAATPGQLLWMRTYRPASGGASFLAVAAGSHGAAYAVGYKRGDQTMTLVLIKYDREGHRRWVREFRGDYQGTGGQCVGLDARGNVYVGGQVRRRSGEYGILLMKYAPDGTLRWSRTLNPIHGSANLRSMVVDRAGKVHLVGGWGRVDVVAKYDPRGRRLWAVRYRDPSDPTAHIGNDLALDGEGDVYVVGAGSVSHTDDTDTSNPLTLKFSGADGSLLASAVYHATSAIYVEAVDVLGSTVAVCGSSSGYGKAPVIDYDLSLNQRYAVEYQPPEPVFIRALDVALDPAGNALVTGYGLTLKFGPDGTLQWQQPAEDRFIRADDSGNSYVGGYAGGLHVTKYDASGDPVWTQTVTEAGWGRLSAYSDCYTLGADGVYIGGQVLAHSRAVLAKFAR